MKKIVIVLTILLSSSVAFSESSSTTEHGSGYGAIEIIVIEDSHT